MLSPIPRVKMLVDPCRGQVRVSRQLAVKALHIGNWQPLELLHRPCLLSPHSRGGVSFGERKVASDELDVLLDGPRPLARLARSIHRAEPCFDSAESVAAVRLPILAREARRKDFQPLRRRELERSDAQSESDLDW